MEILGTFLPLTDFENGGLCRCVHIHFHGSPSPARQTCHPVESTVRSPFKIMSFKPRRRQKSQIHFQKGHPVLIPISDPKVSLSQNKERRNSIPDFHSTVRQPPHRTTPTINLPITRTARLRLQGDRRLMPRRIAVVLHALLPAESALRRRRRKVWCLLKLRSAIGRLLTEDAENHI